MIEKLLKEKFKIINNVLFEKEGNMNFIRIEVNLISLEEITKLSKEISIFLDENYDEKEKFYLDVYSPGTDSKIELSNINNFIGENIQVKLFNSIKQMDSFIGEILSVDIETITIYWNAKGQFRRQKIKLNNIKKIQKYAKIKKGDK